MRQIGGLDVLVQKLSAPLPSPDGKTMLVYLNILPLLGWTAGCAVIWSALFTVGNFLYGRTAQAALLLAVFLASSLVLVWTINRLWSRQPATP